MSPFYGRAPERLGSSLSRRCENKQPKFSVTVQTLALNTPVGGSAQLLRSGAHCYAAAIRTENSLLLWTLPSDSGLCLAWNAAGLSLEMPWRGNTGWSPDRKLHPTWCEGKKNPQINQAKKKKVSVWLPKSISPSCLSPIIQPNFLFSPAAPCASELSYEGSWHKTTKWDAHSGLLYDIVSDDLKADATYALQCRTHCTAVVP